MKDEQESKTELIDGPGRLSAEIAKAGGEAGIIRELDARNRIVEVFLTVPDEEMYSKVLVIVLETMGSKYGVFGYLDEKGGLVVPTMTRMVWDKCQVGEKRSEFARETWGDSSWPTAIREKRTICRNEPSTRTPEGHIPISRHICLPLIHRDGAVGLILVANKETDYSHDDVALIETLGKSIAPVLAARLDRERQEEARRKAEEELSRRRAQEELDRLFRLCSDMICIVGLDGHFNRINPAWEKTLGYSSDELLSRPFMEFVHPEDREATLTQREKLAQGFEVSLFRNRYLRKDGSWRWLEWVAIPVVKERVAYGIARDVTEQKRLAEDLERTMQELKRSNEDLEQFASVASHDLKEPLRTVVGFVQLLARRYKGKLGKDADELIGHVVAGVDRMHRMIDDLLVFSAVGTDAAGVAPTDCEAALAAAAQNLRTAIAQSGAQLSHDPLPVILADEGLMVQLFQNLIENSIKFRGAAPPRIHVGVEGNATEWVFSVRDNGIGIDPRFSDRLFVLFQRLDRRSHSRGTGIGLSICKKIVGRHGGRIWIESPPGGGSTFLFTIPIRGASPE